MCGLVVPFWVDVQLAEISPVVVVTAPTTFPATMDVDDVEAWK